MVDSLLARSRPPPFQLPAVTAQWKQPTGQAAIWGTIKSNTWLPAVRNRRRQINVEARVSNAPCDWCRTTEGFGPASRKQLSSSKAQAAGRASQFQSRAHANGAAPVDLLDAPKDEKEALLLDAEQAAMSEDELELVKQAIRDKRATEQMFGRLIINCRFFTLAGVFGSLIGSALCFAKGTFYVAVAIKGYFMMLLDMPNRCKVVLKLIEALDTYLVGTVMLIFGMGLYELFVMKLDGTVDAQRSGSTLFGLFPLEKRPGWLAISGLDDLKTKLGHVIVMILLVGMFEKSKIVHPTCSLDLLYTAGSVLLCSVSLYLLSRLKPEGKQGREVAGLH